MLDLILENSHIQEKCVELHLDVDNYEICNILELLAPYIFG